MNETIKIAGSFTAGDWKTLRPSLLDSDGDWSQAFGVFEDRIQTRFFTPIELIKSQGRNEGEGFSIALISVVLLEFLASFELGKIYTTDRETLKPNEYSVSSKLLMLFLQASNVFNPHFESKSKVRRFYENIRCGLVHEARTKKSDVIISGNSRKNTQPDRLYFMEGSEGRLNRDLLLSKIKEHISEYKSKITNNEGEHRRYFLMKMDEIAGQEHVWYFVYGSNLKSDRLDERLERLKDTYLMKIRCELPDYEFCYNKRSIDGTSKANVRPKPEASVQGVAVLLLKSTFEEFVLQYEKGYDSLDVAVRTIREPNSEGTASFKAFTCISSKLTDVEPSADYVSIVVEGARENGLPEEYINSKLLRPSK